MLLHMFNFFIKRFSSHTINNKQYRFAGSQHKGAFETVYKYTISMLNFNKEKCKVAEVIFLYSKKKVFLCKNHKQN